MLRPFVYKLHFHMAVALNPVGNQLKNVMLIVVIRTRSIHNSYIEFNNTELEVIYKPMICFILLLSNVTFSGVTVPITCIQDV